MKSFLEYINESSAHPGFKKVQGEIAKKEGISKDRAGAILASASRHASAKAKAENPRLKKVKEETIVEVEGPRSELDKLVFAQHPVKITNYPVADAGEFDVKTTKDKSRKADKPEPNEATGGNPPSESPLYEPQTLGSRQKIMQYFKPESKQDNREPIEEDINGTYRASFYGQLKRRLAKRIVPAKAATQQLTTKIDIDDPKYRQYNGNQQGVKDDDKKDLGVQPVKKLLKKVVSETLIKEVSYDRLRNYMDKNDNEYNKETDKDNPYDGNTQKREKRAKGFSLATNKRIGKNVKVPSSD